MKRKKRLTRTLQIWGIILIIGVAVSITLVDTYESYRDFRRDSETTRQKYVSQQKETIKAEVKRVVDLITFKESQCELLTKTRIKRRVNEAHAIARNIYQQNRNSKGRAEIQTMILDALRPIRYADGSGYYFVTSLEGTVRLFADKPEMEGRNLFDVQDSGGQYPVKDMLKIVRQSGEGFYKYHWSKPETSGNNFKKISFVKLFEPYDWMIGTGLYVEDIEERIENDLLEIISKIRFGKEGYVFINHFNGDALVADGKIVAGQKKLWEVFSKNPVKTKALFDKEYAAAIKPDGDYIYYSMKKLTSPDMESPKVSFIYGLPEQQWLVGAGVYLDDVEQEIALMQGALNDLIKKEIFIFCLVALAILSFFLFLFSRLNRKLRNDSNILISFFKQAAFSDQSIDRDLVHFDELDRMAESANKMLQDKIQTDGQLKMFKTFAESSNQGLGWASIDGIIEYVNPALAALFGEEDIGAPLGKNVALSYYPDEEQQRLEDEIFPTVVKDGQWSGELVIRKVNGEMLPTHNSMFLIFNGASEPVFLANIVSDISERKKAEEDRANLSERLHIAQKMESIGLMAGGVAHDLNNILSGIVAYPELILQKLPQDSELRGQVEAIQRCGQRAATVVADLLTVARGAATAREIHDLNSLVQAYLDSPEYQKLKSLHPDVSCRYRSQSCNSFISCSPVHIQKCLMNLITNAYEAIDDGGRISVSSYNQDIAEEATAEYEMAAGKYVVLNVEDTGPGIAKQDLEHIFEPFYTKKVLGKSGSGLGLAVVWNTMEDHNGKVFVKSSENGTCFQLYFPVATGKAVPHTDKGHVEEIRGKGEHILIVDDERQLRDIARQILTLLGYRVDTVDSGEAALEFVKQKPVDLLLLDMLMEPGMSGRQAYEKILKLYPEQKAIVVSGFSESEDVKATLQLGAGKFIKKPYSMEEIGSAIKEVLKG